MVLYGISQAATVESITRAFEDIDQDNSKSIDQAEFVTAMTQLDVAISTSEVKTIFKEFAKMEGELDYYECLEIFGFVSAE